MGLVGVIGPGSDGGERGLHRIRASDELPDQGHGRQGADARGTQGASMHFRVTRILLLVLACLLGSARAETTVRVLETWPPGDQVELGRNQTFYLRLAYATDVPVRIWVAPYRNGDRVDAGSSPSTIHSGRGEALGWFFFLQPGAEVDEVRVTAGDGSEANTRLVAVWNGRVTGGSAPADDGLTTPGWIAELTALARKEQDEANRARESAPVSTGEVVLFGGFMLAMLAVGVLGLAWPAWALWRWKGGWRLAAAVPEVLMAFVVLRIVIGVARDPTSHNLWPFEILQAGAVGLAWMAVLAVARKAFGKRPP